MLVSRTTWMVLALGLGLAACGSRGGQEPAREPAVDPAPTRGSQQPVAWDSQAPGAQDPVPVSPGGESVAAVPTPTPPPPTPAPPPRDAKPAASTLPAAYQEILDAHNRLRARHCAQPLRWSQELEALAQDWADQLASANCAFEHRQRNRFGENLTFFAPVGSQSPAGVANGWYREVEQYDFSKGDFDFQTGHFTQLVWTSTSELGCGVSRCGGGEIWVCNYNPPGNMMGDFARRVLHPSQCVSSGR